MKKPQFKYSFSFLFFYILSSFITTAGLSGIWQGLIFLSIIVGSLYLHESAHVAIAAERGYGCKGIYLNWSGAVAIIETTLGDNPKDEILIAIAGPICSFLLALAFYIFQLVPINNEVWLFFIEKGLFINLVLGIFNLVPTYPMDGGRVLRGTLSLWMKKQLANKIALYTSLTLGSCMIVWCIFNGPMIFSIIVICWVMLYAWLDLTGYARRNKIIDIS